MNRKPPQKKRAGAVYEIRVEGHLSSSWSEAFAGLQICQEQNGEAGNGITILRGPLADQPALHGVLARIRDLNLTLLSVRRMNVETDPPVDPTKEKS